MARDQEDYQLQQARIVRLSSLATRDLPEAQRKIIFDIKAIETFLRILQPEDRALLLAENTNRLQHGSEPLSLSQSVLLLEQNIKDSLTHMDRELGQQTDLQRN